MILKNKYLMGAMLGVIVISAVAIPLIVINTERLVEHDPIIIWGDEDFKAYSFSGEGTQSDPYLITNYNITTTDNYAVYILGTSKFFKIANCLIQGSKTHSSGVHVENIENNTAIVLNNQIVNCSIGLRFVNSNSNLISNNLFEFNTHSITLEKCQNNSILNNTILKNDNEGILLEIVDSKNTLISNNTLESNFQKDFKILDSSHLNIRNNFFSNVSLSLERVNITTISANIGSSSRVRLVGSILCNVSDNTLQNYSGTSISLLRSSNCSINSNLVKDSDYCAITADKSLFCSIFNNSLERNRQSIGVSESVNIKIYNNTANSIYFGISLVKSDNCTIDNNLLGSESSSDYRLGIAFLDTSGTIITNNQIFGGISGIEATGSTNFTIDNNVIANTKTGIRCSVNAYGSIKNNLITNSTEEGLELDHCRYFNIDNNLFFGNNQGIYLISSYFNMITNNTFEQNFNGMYLFSPVGAIGYLHNHNNTIQYNLFLNNIDYAIKIMNVSRDNEISFNAFILNNLGNIQAYDLSGPNMWYNGTLLKGNFWDDWISGVYAIDGSAGSVDLHPLSTNPIS